MTKMAVTTMMATKMAMKIMNTTTTRIQGNIIRKYTQNDNADEQNGAHPVRTNGNQPTGPQRPKPERKFPKQSEWRYNEGLPCSSQNGSTRTLVGKSANNDHTNGSETSPKNRTEPCKKTSKD
ncbi:hypothetical protein JCM33374_g6675 [Metschnikowia sp. JCM 33374]|nr:hypothetical protein JCM33374_g6675 [Metschnikowia sp. JCM 33374]